MKARAPTEAAKRFASLCPTLLARKGGARPAMRSQLQASRFGESIPRQGDQDDDLGWNDFGEDDRNAPAPAPITRAHRAESADIVPIGRDAADPACAAVPTVARRRKADEPRGEARSRLSALTAGRRAAFTLRLDAERHLKLRLACTVDARSAQQVVTEALDRLLDGMPDIAALADRVAKRTKF